MRECRLQFTVSIHYHPVRYYLNFKEKPGSENVSDLAIIYTASKWQSPAVKPRSTTYWTANKGPQERTGRSGAGINFSALAPSLRFPRTLLWREAPLQYLLAKGIREFIPKVLRFIEADCRGTSVRGLRHTDTASPWGKCSQFLGFVLKGFRRYPATPGVPPHPSPGRSSLELLNLLGRKYPSSRCSGCSVPRNFFFESESHSLFCTVGAPPSSSQFILFPWEPEICPSQTQPYDLELLFFWPPPALFPESPLPRHCH